jgi:tRNA threonylcarbamoyladenosine biosynthesis protein TsaB
MPTILALSNSSDVCSAAIGEQGSIQQKLSSVPREHTQKILPMISALLSERGLSLGQLDAIAFDRGPGSFTGIRICLSIAQGLAYGADLPLIEVSSLDALANQARRQYLSDEAHTENISIVPIIDARMNEVYWSSYTADKLRCRPQLNEQVSNPENSAESIQKIAARRLIGVGSGWYYPVLRNLKNTELHVDSHPSAYDVAELAIDAFDRGELLAPEQAQLQYLRNDSGWRKRQRIRQPLS